MMISMVMAAALGQAAAGMPARRPQVDRQARFDRMFQMADTDRNGQLSRAELQAARERMHERRMARRASGGWGGKGAWEGRQGRQGRD